MKYFFLMCMLFFSFGVSAAPATLIDDNAKINKIIIDENFCNNQWSLVHRDSNHARYRCQFFTTSSNETIFTSDTSNLEWATGYLMRKSDYSVGWDLNTESQLSLDLKFGDWYLNTHPEVNDPVNFKFFELLKKYNLEKQSISGNPNTILVVTRTIAKGDAGDYQNFQSNQQFFGGAIYKLTVDKSFCSDLIKRGPSISGGTTYGCLLFKSIKSQKILLTLGFQSFIKNLGRGNVLVDHKTDGDELYIDIPGILNGQKEIDDLKFAIENLTKNVDSPDAGFIVTQKEN